MTFEQACRRIIIAATDAKPSAMIQYAASYAAAGRHMTDPEEIRVQKLYILNNLSAWRGDEAKLVKAALKGEDK
jgi:hypothetical protein